MDGTSFYSPPKVGTGGYCRYLRLQAGTLVVLNFHTKLGLETLQSGVGWPPLGRPAWGSCHVATDLQTVALITSWRWLAVGLASVLQLLGRPAWVGLPLAH